MGLTLLEEVVFSPDSSMVAYPDFTVSAFRVWSTATGRTVAQFPFPETIFVLGNKRMLYSQRRIPG